MSTLTPRLDAAFSRVLFLFLPAALSMVAATPVQAQTVDEALIDIENRWASAVYESSGRGKKKALTQLLQDARKFASSHASDPKAVGWHGIIARECIRAGCKSPAGRLRKEARDALLKAESLDARALGGRIYANLGALYAQTSSQFGGFGSDVKGIGYLWSALVVDPDCLESNYLYAELLVKEKNLTEALKVLRKASETPARPEHLLADRGRHRQIISLLKTVESRIDRTS